MKKTKDLKIKFLGIIPILKNKRDFFLNPQEIIAFSALLTFKGKDILKLVKNSLKKGEKIEDKIKRIFNRSSLKGHASLSTTPVLCFSFEGSKFLDSALTGFYFGSFLMSSGRRTEITKKDIVFPSTILKNKKREKLYRETSEKNIEFFNFLLREGINKDSASKILQYGIYGTGLLQLPLENIVSLKREFELEKKWMPEEIGFLLKKIEKSLKKLGVDLLYFTRLIAPRNTYYYPNIFKDPQKPNLAREIKLNKEDFKIVSVNLNITPSLKRRLSFFKKEISRVSKSKKEIKRNWQRILRNLREIIRDYNLSVEIQVLSRVPWRVWGEKKRHRTCQQVVDSIYFSIKKALSVFKKEKEKIEKGEISREDIETINKVFSLPPSIISKKKLFDLYLKTALQSFLTYEKLVKVGTKERDAIFIIPRGIKIQMVQRYDLFNVISGFYPLRLCKSAEEELNHLTFLEAKKIKEALKKRGGKILADFISPKCHLTLFCLEEKTCGKIKEKVLNYNDEFHKEMKENLEKEFKKIYESKKGK